MKVEIDSGSGYCFGVEYAIQMAEDELDSNHQLFCLGDIVHNDMEISRLNEKGLQIIDRSDLNQLHDCKVLIRAHGEPPETYKLALDNNIELIDASCPVVLKLQNRVKHAYEDMQKVNGQVVIYGKQGHAEVIGLAGQTNRDAIIISSESDLNKLDFGRPITLFSQTTKSTEGFYRIKQLIEDKIQMNKGHLIESDFEANDSICRQVSNREPNLEKFSKKFDIILFVSGKKSSNGRALFTVCEKYNPNSFFIENTNEIPWQHIQFHHTVGICGATSTPMWLMQKVANEIENHYLTVGSSIEN